MLVVNAGVVKLAVFAPPVNGVVVVLLAYQLKTGFVTPLAVAVKVAVKPLQMLVPGAVMVAATAFSFTAMVNFKASATCVLQPVAMLVAIT